VGASGDVLPVGRFSPARGVWVDRTLKSVTITGMLEMYGPEATIERAQQVQNTLNTVWTQDFPDGYAVKCNVVVRYRAPGSQDSGVTQIEVLRMVAPTSTLQTLSRIQLNANETNVFNWAVAHEFGHLIGLRDRYTESIVSKIGGRLGRPRTVEIQPGYDGNLMAQDQGTLEGKNIADLAAETNPSSAWINDDNHVREWVNAHTPEEIRLLPASDKIKAIRTLMSGWICDGDVAAIVQICKSVNASPEARAIRDAVPVGDIVFQGQRYTVQMALDNMPR